MNTKKITAAVAFVAVLLIGIWFFTKDSGEDTKVVIPVTEVEYEDLGISLAHQEGAVVQRMEGGLPLGDLIMLGGLVIGSSTPDTPKHSVFVFDKSEVAFDESAVAAGITIAEEASQSDVPKPDKQTRFTTWAESNDLLTAYSKRGGEAQMTEVDGVSVLNFITQGTYRQDTYITEYRGRTYLIVGQFNEENDQNHQIFQALISSIYFL